jgi:hypothetical protein
MRMRLAEPDAYVGESDGVGHDADRLGDVLLEPDPSARDGDCVRRAGPFFDERAFLISSSSTTTNTTIGKLTTTTGPSQGGF